LSTHTTRRPRSTAVIAAAHPPGPAPTTMTSTASRTSPRSLAAPSVAPVRPRRRYRPAPSRRSGSSATPMRHTFRRIPARIDRIAGLSGVNRSLMNVVVCVKQIPDPAMPGALDADHTLNRSGKLILDESDSYGVEMALQLVDTAGEGEVTLISMVPNGEVSGLRTALAMGAAKAILRSDDALAGSDALSTAKVLAKCVERAGGIDLVLTATESTDGYTGTIPAQLGELLGWPSLTFAKHIEVADGKVKIQ